MIRKGAIVRYIGNRHEYARGQIFRVRQKCLNEILVFFPCKKPDGSIRRTMAWMKIDNFEEA